MKDYGSTDSGASLGDILGAALEAKSDNKIKKQRSQIKINSLKSIMNKFDIIKELSEKKP